MRGIIAAVVAASALAGVAAAEPASRILRVLGETASPPPGAPARFVIDAVITPGDAAFQSKVKGWWAALPPGEGADEIEGTCVESRCALSGDAASGKLAISADLAGPGAPGGGRLSLTDGEDAKGAEAQVRFTPITGPIAGLGELVAPDAVGAMELSDLLMWNGSATGFSNGDDEKVDWLQREALTEWQTRRARPPTGLIVAEDLATLRREAAAAKVKAGWTLLGDPARGWSAGYPATLLPAATRAGAEQRFTSADQAAVLLVAVDPPLDEAAWDALVDQKTDDRPGVDNRSYTRVNDDMEISYEEKGRVVLAAYRRREGGVARLEFSYPTAQRDAYDPFDTILRRSLHVTDSLKAP
jgi:hypothetical protein